MTDHLDRCEIHGAGPCDCKAFLVALGCMDRLLEERLEIEPAFAEEVRRRLAVVASGNGNPA